MPQNSDTSPAVLPTFGARGPARTYHRSLIRFRSPRVTVQVLVIAQGRARMSVHADADAIDVDFKRQQVVDPDKESTYLRRPGFYLFEKLAELKESGCSAILFNGNNIGYWGNQYVIHNHKLQYKKRGPIFDDGDLLTHAHNGDHAFFLANNNGFRIESLALVGSRRPEGCTLEDLNVPGGTLPRYGLSGFPLLRRGQPVWQDHGPLAWDPGLLFDLGRIPHEWTVAELRDNIAELLQARAPLARHPMTVVGLDVHRQIVLMVVERSSDSKGMTVAEAAHLLRRRFAVRDAIVLGAAGDAQLATTEEGVLTEPLVAAHAIPSAVEIPEHLLDQRLCNRPVWARPVPCYVQFDLAATDVAQHTRPSAEPAGMA